MQKVSVTPTADTWYVVSVRGVGGGLASLFPLAWHGVSSDSSTGLCAPRQAKAWAISTPIFVDANGSGAYDDFPLKQGLTAWRPPVAQPKPALHAMTNEELVSLLKRVSSHE